MSAQLQCQIFMTHTEVKALMLCKDTLCSSVDPVFLALQLYSSRYISKELFDEILMMFNDGHPRTYISNHLINKLPYQTRLLPVLQSLTRCGYHTIASKSFLCLVLVQTGVLEVQKCHYEDRQNLHKYYRHLTIMLSDAQFNKPKAALRSLAENSMAKFMKENDPVKKQWFADKLVTVLAVEIDAHAITADTDLSQNELFTELKSLIPYTKNTLLSDVIYFARLATAFTLAKDFGRGEEMLLAAKTSACNIGQCLELMTLVSIELCFRLRQFEITPTKELQDTIMMLGRTGLEILESEDYETRLIWKRVFILRMVFCLLGIGKFTNLIANYKVDNKSITMAKGLLAKLDESFQGIEQRRKMFYYVAKARLFQCQGHIDEALMFIKMAEKLACTGNFTECEFIMQLKQNFDTQKTTESV